MRGISKTSSDCVKADWSCCFSCFNYACFVDSTCDFVAPPLKKFCHLVSFPLDEENSMKKLFVVETLQLFHLSEDEHPYITAIWMRCGQDLHPFTIFVLPPKIKVLTLRDLHIFGTRQWGCLMLDGIKKGRMVLRLVHD